MVHCTMVHVPCVLRNKLFKCKSVIFSPALPGHLSMSLTVQPHLPLDLYMHVLSFLSAEERTQARAVAPEWRVRLDERRGALRTARLVERFGSATEAFHRAAQSNGGLDVGLLLQVPGVDATANENEALRFAASNGHLAVVERLLHRKMRRASERANK